jgi:murein DD-endopeptidase MepM/ murein hydrolase activator NlpD
LEQQKIAIETPGLFEHSDNFYIDFAEYSKKEFCFPLPVGKATVSPDDALVIITKPGDAIKAMFDGVVRMSWNHPKFGHVVVLRHQNGLETLYAYNRENRVRVGESVKAGQTVAIVGGQDSIVFCEVAIMVNGGRINPSILIAPRLHRLLKQKLLFKKKGFHVEISVVDPDPWIDEELRAEETRALLAKDPFEGGTKFVLDLTEIKDSDWHYPLPGSKVISPYGRRGGRAHSGVDVKTKPNDGILAAFDGVVVMSQVFYGYGNCIILRHPSGLETLYSHNSKNLVRVGDHVKAGQKIALTGRTGRATTEHLHFEIRVGKRHYNPNVIFDYTTRTIKRRKLIFMKDGNVSVQ